MKLLVSIASLSLSCYLVGISSVLAEEFKMMGENTSVINLDENIQLRKIWSLNDGSDFEEFLFAQYEEKVPILYLQTNQPHISMLIINGNITPIIFVSDKYELWKIKGLKKEFENATGISVHSKGVKVSGGRNDKDVYREWDIRFSDNVGGLNIEFNELSTW